MLQQKITRPTQMIVNPNYLPLYRDQLIQLHLDIPMSKSIDHLCVLVIEAQWLAPRGDSKGLRSKCTTNESALGVGYELTVHRWGGPVSLLPLRTLASQAVRWLLATWTKDFSHLREGHDGWLLIPVHGTTKPSLETLGRSNENAPPT